jgi:hypothetical protein
MMILHIGGAGLTVQRDGAGEAFQRAGAACACQRGSAGSADQRAGAARAVQVTVPVNPVTALTAGAGTDTRAVRVSAVTVWSRRTTGCGAVNRAVTVTAAILAPDAVLADAGGTVTDTDRAVSVTPAPPDA